VFNKTKASQKVMNVQSPEFVPNLSFNSSNGDLNNTSNSDWTNQGMPNFTSSGNLSQFNFNPETHHEA